VSKTITHFAYHVSLMISTELIRSKPNCQKGEMIVTINQNREWGGIMLEEATRAILAMWYNTARDRVFGSDERERN